MNRSDAWQRVVTWSAIVGYALAISGLPLPLGAVGKSATATGADAKRLAVKDRSRPFPCMDKPCGCATAEQCFTNCCCNTPAETLAWARAHAVEPAVLAALKRRAAAAPPPTASCCSVQQQPKQAGCCDEGPEPDCCAAPAQPSCCASAAQPASGAADAPTDPAAEPLSRETVVLRAMLACGGIVAQWVACGVSLPPPVSAACDHIMIVIASVETTDLVPRTAHAAPDVPPPRAA